MDMAVPQPTDARMPCPVCRAPIHPIAGRCKHCKADLAAQRSSRPAAGVALPPLAARPRVPTPVAVPVADAPADPVAQAAAPTIVDAPSAPILPPRPTGRMGTATVSHRSVWKSWPVIVIALASIAIIAAVILMAFPPGSAGADSGTAGKHGLEPPPAPEHMDQNPMLPPSAPHSQLTPPPTAPDPVPRHVPDPLPVDPDPADPADPFAGLGALGGGRTPFAGGAATHGMGLMLAVVKHACDRLQQCGTVDDTMRITCQMTLRSMPSTAAPSCPAAQRCLAKVDQMDCGSQANDMGTVVGLMTQLQDCVDAISC